MTMQVKGMVTSRHGTHCPFWSIINCLQSATKLLLSPVNLADFLNSFSKRLNPNNFRVLTHANHDRKIKKCSERHHVNRVKDRHEKFRLSHSCSWVWENCLFNPLNPELNPICYLLALLAHYFLHVSRIRVKLLTFKLLMSYIYIWSTHSWCF